jgi:hypothetical protein
MSARALILAVALALPAQAQNQNSDPAVFLPDRKDVVSWKLLQQVQLVKAQDRYVPQFSAEVTALDKKQVKMQGFMLPLEMGDKQSHFVLAAMPQHCPFCMPGGPESMVEVKSKRPVKYTFEAIVLTGKLEVLKDDPRGVFYALTDAVESR